MKNSIFLSFLLFSAALFSACGTSQPDVSQACPEDAKLCSDGSSVVRSGTDCQFDACPNEDLITVASPLPFARISSPIEVSGEARGEWYFEASFPVQVLDANGSLIGQGIAEAQGDWMIEDFVPFKATISFEDSSTATGTIVLRKDNPSGLPENDDELRVPVSFSSAGGEEGTPSQTIKLYYYNPSLDQDGSGNLQCSRQGLVAVEREVGITQTPIQDTIKRLIQGDISDSEGDAGIESEYPLTGFSLLGASLNDGVLTLEFSDPQNKTVGGSCRVGVLWAQIEATAKQFPEVREVRFQPEELFQP